MFQITVETDFTAEHQLKFTDGTVEPAHSHNWHVKVALESENLDSNGLVADFNIIKAQMDGILKDFQGQKLENLDCFKDTNASAENIAEYLFKALEHLTEPAIELKYVEITEQKGCKARYFR